MTSIRWLRRRGESGSVAPAMPIIAAALLILGGLGVDGSRQLNARGQAVAFAEEAARAGAQGVDVNADRLELDPGLVRARVADYCARVLARAQVSRCRLVGISEVSAADPRPLVVETEVGLSVEASLLGLVGVRRLTASAGARARPFEGIDAPID
ncbi:MAG: pilus assembly protein TadG-related protein [Nocardioides sp.]